MKHCRTMVLLLAACILCAGAAAAEKSNIGNITSTHSTIETEPVSFVELEEIPRSTGLTLMIYMCGSTLEEYAASASIDLIEMASSGFQEENVNIVVMAGGSRYWYLPQISSESTGIYQLGSGGVKELYNDGEQHNMGEEKTLSFFLDYTRENFPSEQYALIMWDHGGGSLNGICEDTNFNADSLSMNELADALKNSSFANQKLSWIGFDACIMASAEVAMFVAPYSEYMIASEESEPGFGWDYGFLKELDSRETPVETGKRIVDMYIDSCLSRQQGRDASTMYTLSCVDLSEIESLADCLNEFILTIPSEKDNFPSISKARRTVTSFGRNEEYAERDFDLIDLGDMANKLATEGSSGTTISLMDALQKSVPVYRSTKQETYSSGLTLYFPYYNKYLYSECRDVYQTLSISKNYGNFINFFGDELINYREDTWDSINNIQIEDVHRDNRTIVSLGLTEKQAAEADLAEIIALQQDDDKDTWRIIATQKAEINEYGRAAGEYVHTNLFVTDADGKPMYDMPLLYIERDDGLYSIPVNLIDSDGEKKSARLICSRDPVSQEMTVEAVYLYDEVINGYSPRLSADLSDYSSISYTVEEKQETYFETDGSAILRPYDEWTVVRTYDFSWDLEKEWKLMFVRDYLDTNTISVMFRITDIYNNTYLSNPLKITDSDAKDLLIVDYDDNGTILIDRFNVHMEPSGMLFLPIQNISDTEKIIQIHDVKINNTERPLETQVYGSGEHEGLESGEMQTAVVFLPLTDSEGINQITVEFDLTVSDGTEEEKIGVRITADFD